MYDYICVCVCLLWSLYDVDCILYVDCIRFYVFMSVSLCFFVCLYVLLYSWVLIFLFDCIIVWSCRLNLCFLPAIECRAEGAPVEGDRAAYTEWELCSNVHTYRVKYDPQMEEVCEDARTTGRSDPSSQRPDYVGRYETYVKKWVVSELRSTYDHLRTDQPHAQPPIPDTTHLLLTATPPSHLRP